MNKYFFRAFFAFSILVSPLLAYAAFGTGDWLTDLVFVVVSTMVFLGLIGVTFLVRGIWFSKSESANLSPEVLRLNKMTKYLNIFLGIYALGMLVLFIRNLVTWYIVAALWAIMFLLSILELQKGELKIAQKGRLLGKIYSWTIFIISLFGFAITMIINFS